MFWFCLLQEQKKKYLPKVNTIKLNIYSRDMKYYCTLYMMNEHDGNCTKSTITSFWWFVFVFLVGFWWNNCSILFNRAYKWIRCRGNKLTVIYIKHPFNYKIIYFYEFTLITISDIPYLQLVYYIISLLFYSLFEAKQC